MRVAKMAVMALCVMAAGCGTARVTPSGPAQASARASRVGTAAGNRAAAQAEAARLMSLAEVPPGAVRLSRPPRSLAGPAMGTPVVTSLVDRVAAWRVGLPLAAVRAWLSAHPPRGLPLAASGSGSASGASTIGASYRGPAGQAWQSANLEISAASAGADASTIRVDAVIVWLDPRPVPSGSGTHPIRVTVAGGCPSTDQGVTRVTNPGSGLTQRLLPPGQPTAGLRCRYDGMGGHAWHLAASKRLTALAARQAAASMGRLRLSHPDGEKVNCPMDDGSAEILALAYPGRPDIDLWIKLSGCRTVSNGHVTAEGS